jgi:DNA-binding XRE family transcriptional regulator
MSDSREGAKRPAIKKPKRTLDPRFVSYRGVWVFVEHERGHAHPVSWELIGKGRELADKLGVHRTVVANMERGRPTTSIVVYVSMLWALNLSHHLEPVASPLLDAEGMALARSTERNRASEKRGGLDNDF